MSLPPNHWDHYHAHVYFDAASVERATALCLEAGEHFDVEVGRVHRKPVGPHPSWSCQLAFDRATFDRLIPWLEEHRNGLTVLVHANTGDHLADHTRHANWLGQPRELDLSIFEPSDGD